MHILREGTLQGSGAPYQVILQGAGDVDRILAFQQMIYDALAENEKHFIIPKSRAFFEDHLARGGHVLGIVSGGRLIAQSIIVHPTKKHPKNGMTQMALAERARPEHITVLQGVFVDPAFRGNHLMPVMIREWLKISAAAGRRHAIAEVAADNAASWLNFMRCGLAIESIGFKDEDYNMHGHLRRGGLRKHFTRAARKKAVTCPQNDIERQKELIARGYRGGGYDPASRNLLFYKRRRLFG